MGWRDVKEQARNIVHDTMSVRCWCVPASGGSPVEVRARVHALKLLPRNEGLGRLENVGYAEREEVHPTLVFSRPEVVPVKNDVFIFTTTEGYRIEADRAEDEKMIGAKSVRLEESRVATIITQHSLDMTFGGA